MSKFVNKSVLAAIAASVLALGATLAQAQSIGPGVVTERPLYQQAADEIRSWSFGKVAAQIIANDEASPDVVPAMDLIDSTKMYFGQLRDARVFTLYSPVEPTTGPEGAPYNWVYSSGTTLCTTDYSFRASKGFRPKLASPVMEGGAACFSVRVLSLPWLPQGQ